MRQVMITTNDNPFDPFDNFDEWFHYDCEKGYYSCSVLMRIASFKDDFTDLERNIEIERAIDAIVEYDFTDTFKKVSKDFPDVEETEYQTLEST